MVPCPVPPNGRQALPTHHFESEYCRPATYSQLHLLQLTDCFSTDFGKVNSRLPCSECALTESKLKFASSSTKSITTCQMFFLSICYGKIIIISNSYTSFFSLNSCSHNVLDLLLQAGVCQKKSDFCFLLEYKPSNTMCRK